MGLKQRKIAIFIADYYEDLESWYPHIRLKEEGEDITVIDPQKGNFQEKRGDGET
jgi:putative intracellular protease/amidase